MKSSTRRLRWLMITLFIVLMALCLGFSMFFMACKSDEPETPPASSEENPDDGGGEKETTVESVKLSESELSLTVDGSTEITVTVTMKEGYDAVDFSYAVDANGIITVTQSGDKLTVKADAAGTATITVTADGVSATCKVTVSAGSSSSGETEYEWVPTSFDVSVAVEENGGTGSSHAVPTDGYTQGIFTIASGAYFNDDNINTQGKDITIVLSGKENEISFKATGASSNNYTIFSLTKDGVDVTPSSWPTEGVYNGADNVSFSATGLGAGTYVLKTDRSAKIYDLAVRQYLEVSDPSGITVTAANTDFLIGTTLGISDLGLNIYLDYENGRQDPLTTAQVTTDLSTLDTSIGMHELTVTYNYTDGDSSVPFLATVELYFYSIESMVISDFSMERSGSSYITHNVQKVFLVGDEVNYDYAAVTATAVCTYKDGDGKDVTLYNDFVLDASDVTFSDDANTASANSYTVTATCNVARTDGEAKTATYTINVVEVTASTDITTVRVIAPSEEDEAEQATYAAGTDGVVTVSTINDAVQLIKLMGATDAERKYIYVGEGQYWEKVYIDIPNLSIIGSNPTTSENGTEGDLLGTRSEATEIVYWAFNGLMDPSGSTNYSTVGSATFTVASSATGFYAESITFRNYWNTNELYNECHEISSDTQADAAYINADKVHFYNVTFTGYHDTLEAENGRQYYENCYIEGRTDYIFGDTATCYFYQCNIHTIGGGSSTNGGYVTAVKGGSMTYGYVFDGCNFTSDLKSYYTDVDGNENVPYTGFAYTEEGTVSLGRTWSSSDMHVAVINSTLDAGYSKTAYGTSGKNPRYTSMSGYAPTESYLVEYGNTGDGAITETLSGTCSVLTGASSYTIENIFAATNGGMTYSDSWNPSTEKTITVTVKSGTDTIATIKATGSISVSDLETAVNARLSDSQVEGLYSDENCTTPLESAVSSDTTVYVKTEDKDMSVTESTYWDLSAGAYGDVTESKYLDSEQKLYLDCGEEGNGSMTVHNASYYILNNGASLKLILNEGSVLGIGVYQLGAVTVTDENGNDVTSQGTADNSGSKNNFAFSYTATESGTYTISQSTAEGAGTLYLIYINVMVPITETTTISYQDGPNGFTIQSYDAWYKDTYVVATNGKFAFRNDASGNHFDVQVNTGTTLYLQSVAGATVTFTTGSNADISSFITVSDTGLIKIDIPALDSGSSSYYIYTLTITVPTT